MVKYLMLYQFEINTYGMAPEIYFTIKFGNLTIAQFSCDDQLHVVEYKSSDEDDNLFCPRSFQILINGKNKSHTIIDQDGNIKTDCHALIDKIIFDDIDVTSEYCQGQGTYTHDNNGNSDMIDDEFYGFMGCNGTVTLNFSTPLHLWMLEKCQ